MQAENWKKVKKLLDEVLSLETTERQDFLNNSEINAEIRAEVESLLGFEEESESLMHLSAVEFSKDFFEKNEEIPLIGQKIGVYRIVGELGQGGMGAVYLAERADGKFSQQVALKLLKREMNTYALRRRFQQEREILASLEHPNIARLLDAGTTADKIPFLAMEYVGGLPIDEYCNKHRLDLNSRLDLFRKVCSAAGFAHQNLIVHRDLKPSNILVTTDGIPKLLDFGISKILSAEFEQINSATVTKLGVMTPGYASPEQLQSKSVTTATDIYSLGVILYELLSGHRPFETKEGSLKEIYKAVLENEPPPPSALIDTILREIKQKTNAKTELKPEGDFKSATKLNKSESDTESNKMRRTVSNTVNLSSQSLRGDLDNIVLKALRKEPERRYSSAESFADDIHRHQRGLPVTARPNTFSYRAEKFIKRNKVAVIGSILVAMAIAGGIIATLWQSRVARTERDRAQLEAEKAGKINLYLQNVLNLSNPMWISANPESNLNATVAEAVDEAAETIETDLAGQPEIQAEIHYTLGKTYIGQGQFEKGKAQLQKAKEKFLQVAADNTSKVMQLNSILGMLAFAEGSEADGEQMLTESVAYFRANLYQAKENNKWLAMSLSDLARVIAKKGKIVEAENQMRESMQFATQLNGQERWLLVNIIGDLGDILLDQGKMDEAVSIYQSAIEEGNKLSTKPHAETANNYYDLGRLYKKQEKFAEAQENIQMAYKIFKETLGEENFYTAMTRKQIAELYYFQGDYAKARAEIDEVIKTVSRTNPEKPNLYNIYAEEVLANILTKTGEAAKAEIMMREIIASYKKLLESPHPAIAGAKQSLGETLIAQKKIAEARQILTDSEKEFIASVGENNPETQKCRELLNSLSK